MSGLLKSFNVSSIKRVYLTHHHRFFSQNVNEESILIALGGNAIQKSTEQGTVTEMMNNINIACEQMSSLITKSNRKLIITHGNGPQIGSLYLQNETCADITPSLPLFLCGAATQGMIGYMLQQSLQNLLPSDYNVISHITQVIVNENDDAWNNPSKPIGKYYSAEESYKIEQNALNEGKKVVMMEDKARDGYRIAVASPRPIDIVENEKNIIKTLINDNNNKNVMIACGGGGIPVIKDKNNNNKLIGIDKCVIDKDLSAVKLGICVNADYLIIATDIECVYLDFMIYDSYEDRDELQRKGIRKMSVSQAQNYYDEGHFLKGSMGPKVLAAIQFVSETNKICIICALNDIEKAIKGESGTTIFP